MLPISLSSSSVHSLTPDSSSFLIVSMVLCPLVLPPFHHLQFLSNLAQYSSSYLLSDHPNNFLAVNRPGNSPLLNVPSSFSCFLTSSISRWYSFSYSSIASLAFPKFSLPSQVSDSADHILLLLVCLWILIVPNWHPERCQSAIFKKC